MWIILGVLLSFSALALAPFENLKNVKILKVLPNNIIMLNRGIEDGILRNDHAKISNESSGYNSRAICLKVSADVSYWKIYRVPEAEAFSLDYTYSLIGLADREIPFPQVKIRDERFIIVDKEDRTNKDPKPPVTIKSDLPEKLD